MGFDLNFDNLLTSLPVVGGLFDNSDKQALAQLQQNQQLYGDIPLPNLQWQDFKPEAYQYQGDVQGQTIQEDPMIRSAQLSTLSKMAGLADTGLSAVDQAGYENARQMAGQIARSGNEAALNNAEARGVAGGGLEYAMREQAIQDAAQRAQQAALQQASDSARQRALYTQAYGSALSGVRGQDYNTAQANAGIINQFNQANMNRRQDIANQNTGLYNQAQMYNHEGQNQINQQKFNNQITKAGGQAQANTGMAQGYGAQNAARTSERDSNTQILANSLLSAYGKKKTGEQ